MRGFDTKALILFPKLESYEHKPAAYKHQFQKAVRNLVTYLDSMEIKPYVFYTDDIARKLRIPELEFIQTLPVGDLFFASKYCENMSDALEVKDDMFTDIIQKVQEKDPGDLNMTNDQRFELVNRHNNAVIKKVIPQFNIVFHFAIPNRAQYKVTSKPDDGRIRVTVNANTFAPTVLFGGREENPCNVLAVPYASRTLDNWR